MNCKNTHVPLDKARELTRRDAKQMLLGFHKSDTEILDEAWLSEKNFWVFFINRKITFPPEAEFAASAAYAVSHTGEIRAIPDLSSEPDEMKKLFERLTRYFEPKST